MEEKYSYLRDLSNHKHLNLGERRRQAFRMVTTIWFILGLSVTRVVYGGKCGGNRSYLLVVLLHLVSFTKCDHILGDLWVGYESISGHFTNESDLNFKSIQNFCAWLFGYTLCFTNIMTHRFV